MAGKTKWQERQDSRKDKMAAKTEQQERQLAGRSHFANIRVIYFIKFKCPFQGQNQHTS